jgi:hypothetical protein
MPSNHCLWRDYNQSFFPGGPELMANDPEQFVEQIQPWSRVSTFQNDELLSEGKILEDEMPTTTKRASKRSEPERKQIEHGLDLYQNHGWTRQQVIDSTVGQSFGEGQDHLLTINLLLTLSHIYSSAVIPFQAFLLVRIRKTDSTPFPARKIMKIAQRSAWFAVLLIIGSLITPCVRGQGRGAYAAGINYPAGPPTIPTNTGYWLGGTSPTEIHTGYFNAVGKSGVVMAASCAYNSFPACTSNGSLIVVYLSNGDGTFSAPIVTSGNLPPELRSIAVGDFNGDGNLDVAAAADCLSGQDCSSGTITIFLGNGDGTFTQSSQYPLNGIVGQAGTLAVGKFSSGGNLDLAVGIECFNIPVNGCAVGSVSIYLGNGDGTLGSPTNYTTTGNSALYPVVGDFNGDGKLDVIAGSTYAPPGGSASNSSLTVWLGNGDGTFNQPYQVVLPFSGLDAITAGDVNSDGKLDLVLTPYGGGSIQIAIGNGDGSFQSPTAVNTGFSYQFDSQIVDMNNDGKPDIVVSGDQSATGSLLNGTQVLLNDGTGNFVPGSVSGLTGSGSQGLLVTSDFNNDGNPDILVGSPGGGVQGFISVLLGNGDGTMQGAGFLNQAAVGGNSVVSADLNGDGIPDLIETAFLGGNTTPYGILVSLGTGNGKYAPPVAYSFGATTPYSLVAGDFNGDGKIDVAVASSCLDDQCAQGAVTVLLGNGDGTFQSPVSYGTGGQYSLSIVTGDFNGDGKLDVAVVNQSSSVSILLGNGDGTLQPAVVTSVGNVNLSIAAADFNGDGKTDLALDFNSGSSTGGSVQILLSGANGSLTPLGSPYPTGGNGGQYQVNVVGGSLGIADVNNDGALDIIIANQCQLADTGCSFGSLVTLFGNGDGTFRSGPIQTVPDGNLYSLFLSDVNGDGILDAVATDPTGVEIFLGNGDGSFLTPTVYAGVQFPGQNTTLALADLNIIQPGGSTDQTAILVNRAGTYLVTKSSANPSSLGEAIQLTTTASSSYLANTMPTGSITYYDGTTLLGMTTLSGGTASLNVNNLTQGVHTITAYYSGDANFNAHSGTQLLQVVSAAQPAVKFSPTSLTFAAQDTGTASTAKTITLSDPGQANLYISSIAITGANSGDFSETNTCGAGIGINGTCKIIVTFSPAAIGSRKATVTVTDDAPGNPQSVALTGTGTMPVTITPTTLAFGNQAVGSTSASKSVIVKNTSPGTLTITSISLTGANPVSYNLTNPCGISLASEKSCTLTVTFSPSTSGALDASITLNDSASNSPQTVSITGTGIAPVTVTPASLIFANQNVGTTSAAKTVTLKNDQSTSLTGIGISYSGPNAGDFSNSTTCTSVLAAGKTCTISVKFAPSVAGAESATLVIADSASDSPQQIPLSGTGVISVIVTPASLTFASQTVGITSAAKTVTVKDNSTTASLTITGIALSGNDPGDFNATNNCVSPLAPATSCTISVTFDPTATESRTALLTVNDLNGTTDHQTVSLSGSGK